MISFQVVLRLRVIAYDPISKLCNVFLLEKLKICILLCKTCKKRLIINRLDLVSTWRNEINIYKDISIYHVMLKESNLNRKIVEISRCFIDTVIYSSFINSLLYQMVLIIFGIDHINTLHPGARLKPNQNVNIYKKESISKFD